MKHIQGVLVAAGLLALASPAALLGQKTSNAATVALTATLPESLSISLDYSAVSFNLVSGGKATGNTPVTVTTKWVLAGC